MTSNPACSAWDLHRMSCVDFFAVMYVNKSTRLMHRMPLNSDAHQAIRQFTIVPLHLQSPAISSEPVKPSPSSVIPILPGVDYSSPTSERSLSTPQPYCPLVRGSNFWTRRHCPSSCSSLILHQTRIQLPVPERQTQRRDLSNCLLGTGPPPHRPSPGMRRMRI